MSDIDNKIGFWLKGIHYFWLQPVDKIPTIENCRRIYIFDLAQTKNNIYLFDKFYQYFEIASADEKKLVGAGEPLQLITCDNSFYEYEKIRRYFGVWSGKTFFVKNNKQDFNSIRVEGNVFAESNDKVPCYHFISEPGRLSKFHKLSKIIKPIDTFITVLNPKTNYEKIINVTKIVNMDLCPIILHIGGKKKQYYRGLYRSVVIDNLNGKKTQRNCKRYQRISHRCFEK